MSCLNHLLICHDLVDQVLIDLAECTIKHLATFEHVENAIREDRLVVADPIDVKDKFT